MIQMIGTNHRIAPVEIRSRFSLDQEEQIELMEDLSAVDSIRGVVVLSTCNRTEIWISTDAKQIIDLKQLFFGLREIDEQKFGVYFSDRSDVSAVQHLFYLASGLRSAILAEDQILAQVKDALDFSREKGYTDNCLEVVFRMAITAAKEVKTKVHFTHVNGTAIDRAVHMLEAEGMDLRGQKCLVIGNGKYGKLASTTLRDKGADVHVTVRRYHQGSNRVSVPDGCHMIDYMDRMEYLKDAVVIISATSSPHYTVAADDVQWLNITGRPVLIDLAVPRDVDPQIREMDLFRCYDIDDFKTSESELNSEAYEEAREIIDRAMAEFWNWHDTQELVPHIQQIRDFTVNDLEARLHKIVRNLELSDGERETLGIQIETAAGKVATKLMFELRKHISPEEFKDVIAGLEKVYEDE